MRSLPQKQIALLLILFLATIPYGCTKTKPPVTENETESTSSQQSSHASEPIPKQEPEMNLNELEISPQTVKKMLDEKQDFVLIDCREQDEYDLVHIDPSQLVPLSLLEEKAPQIGHLKQKQLVVYCHHGRRSMMATKWLLEHGFTNVKSMAGGIDRWSEEIDPNLKRY